MAALESTLDAVAEQLSARRDDSEESWLSVLEQLSAAAAGAVPGAAYAGLTMRDRGGVLISRAPSHDEIVELDRAQAELAEGPCVDALRPGGAAVIEVPDLAASTARWPRFAPRATAAGITGLLSYGLAPHGAAPGSFNFYATTPGAFGDPATRLVAAAFAAQAAVAVYGADRAKNLNRALDSRDVIGRAKGILMERFGLDDGEAFALLVRSSQDTNVKLIDVAVWLTDDTATRAHRDRRPDQSPPTRLPT
jgi:hypothetical protein